MDACASGQEYYMKYLLKEEVLRGLVYKVDNAVPDGRKRAVEIKTIILEN